jgi:hypothetical protein
MFSTSQFISLLLAPLRSPCWSICPARDDAGRNGEESGLIHTISVPEDSDGVRLDRFLASVLADLSRSHIQKLIKDGHIRSRAA